MWERRSRSATLSTRILVLVSVGCLLTFLVTAAPASAATTHVVKVGGAFFGSPLAQGGVVWFNGYDPDPIVIRPGDMVQWKLIGGVHTVTSTDPFNATAWDYDSSPLFTVEAALADMSPGLLLPPGSVYENDTQFLTPGTYAYFCKIHPGMGGNLTVVGAIPPVEEIVNVVAGWGDSVYAVQAFAPENIQVLEGTIVRWTLINPTEPHTITGLNQFGNIVWDSSPLLPPGPPPVMGAPGQPPLFNWTFEKEGTFTYFCKVHAYLIGESWAGMVGTVIVERSASEAVGSLSSGLSPLTYAGLGIGTVALLIGLGAIGVARRKGKGGTPPPNP
jgi:plastocyanin